MNNFGVIEVATGKTRHAPGWAYVPDSSLPSHSFANQQSQPTDRKKRAARLANAAGGDHTARQNAKLQKELEALDKEPSAGRDVPVPSLQGRGRNIKHTPNVRKILQSQKTFANHLDDWVALGSLQAVQEQAAQQQREIQTASLRRGSTAVKKADRRKSSTTTAPLAAAKPASPPRNKDKDDSGTSMDLDERDGPSYPPDGSILPAYNKAPPAEHPGDNDPLLVSRTVPFPTDEELRALMTAPPLTYLDARAGLVEGDEVRAAPRKFCEVCGYWGRVKCGKCGGRVCALECMETHREECVRRYGI